jgi:hypothetical protein
LQKTFLVNFQEFSWTDVLGTGPAEFGTRGSHALLGSLPAATRQINRDWRGTPLRLDHISVRGDFTQMGKLITMPLRTSTNAGRAATEGATVISTQAEEGRNGGVPFDCRLWLNAPRERTPSYFPVYSSVSKAIQSALRQWAGDWLCEHPDALDRRVFAYSLLVFSCTRPYSGRPSNIFTYDVQQGSALDQALRTAGRRLSERLAYIDGVQRAAGRPGTISLMPARVADYVRKNRRTIYKMFNVETLLMNEILKFTQISIPKMGPERAAAELCSAFARHLRRFTDEFDMAERTGELLRIATDALISRQGIEDEMPVSA